MHQHICPTLPQPPLLYLALQVYRQPIPVADIQVEDLHEVRVGGSFKRTFTTGGEGNNSLLVLLISEIKNVLDYFYRLIPDILLTISLFQ